MVSDFGNAGQGPTGARPQGVATFAVVGVPPPPPDLIVSTLSVPPAAAAGATINVTDTTKNTGQGGADPTATNYYLSVNKTYEASKDTLLGGRAVPALNPGQSNKGPRVSVAIPSGTPNGSYFILARADGNDTEDESSESNNVRAKAIGIGPDLFISQLSGPSSAAAGGTITVTDTTKNQIGAADAPASTTYFYLSENKKVNPIDVLVGNRPISPLMAGQSNQGQTQITIPTGTAPGPYFIIAYADGANGVIEGSENNNFRLLVITITP
jgi:subtilase family serine protease